MATSKFHVRVKEKAPEGGLWMLVFYLDNDIGLSRDTTIVFDMPRGATHDEAMRVAKLMGEVETSVAGVRLGMQLA